MKRKPRSSNQKSKVTRRTVSLAPSQFELLIAIADLLLSRGITPAQLHALMEPAFAQAAARSARLKNGRVSYSRVAAKTGLRRAAVRDLLRQGATTLRAPNPVDRLILGWRADNDFLDRSGKPKFLRIDGKEGAFARLADRYARDIPKRALVHELVDAGLASDHGSELRLHRPKVGKSLLASKSFRASVLRFLSQLREGKAAPALMRSTKDRKI
jgi:Family of unknown function (DUF6502)